MQVGWIGLGAIGANMVLRACDAGHDITAFARGKGLSAVEAKGARLSDDYRALAAGSDIVVLCLFDDNQVRSVLFGEGALAAVRPGSILVNHTTGSPELAREICEKAPAGVAVLDATFSGGPDSVLAGELTVMVGGNAASVERVRPLLASYARAIFQFGSVGSGQTIKLLNNLLFATNLKNAAELLKIAASQGFDQSEVAKVIQSCSGGSSAMRSFCSGASLEATLARIWPYVEKDVATVASSAASNGIDIGAFHETVAYFKDD